MPVLDEGDDGCDKPEGVEETGLWCNACMLPSGARFVLTTESGKIGTMVVCVDCEKRLDQDGNPCV